MFKSLAAKLTGLGAAAMIAGTLAAHPAAASAIRSPCNSGPSITQSGTSIIGACFVPMTSVTIHFVGVGTNKAISPVTTSASFEGLISVTTGWDLPCQTELVYGQYGPNAITTNILQLTCPRQLA
jgi:hypothetical protein